MEVNHELSTTSLIKLISFLFWSGLYIGCIVNFPKCSPEWCCRVVTLIHGSVASVVGLIQCDVCSLTMDSFKTAVQPWHYALMVWTWGYFAFDLLWCFVYWSETQLILWHHATALIGLSVYMPKEFTGRMFPCSLALLEITNPLLQTRWFLKNSGYTKTFIYNLIEILYLGGFLIVRGLLGTYVIYRVIESDVFELDEKIVSLVIYCVSLVFIYQICTYVAYRCRNKPKGNLHFSQNGKQTIWDLVVMDRKQKKNCT